MVQSRMCHVYIDFIDLLLLGVLILRRTSKPGSVTSKDAYESSSLSATLNTPPQLPPLTYIRHHRISLLYPPSSPIPPLSPGLIPSMPLPQPKLATPTRPSEQHEEQHAEHHTHNDGLSLVNQPNHPPNRITFILRLCALQNLPAGNWSYTPELGTLVNTWAQRSIVMAAPSSSPHGLGITALAHACLTDLCHTVWSAQREGRENDVLSGSEMRTLEGVGWDLGWAGWRIRLAGCWLREQERAVG
ncbi:hypothetical protein N657DRAFT_301102 [Parathielavia appendiculata]|uniref:Uncharacterized protein n=1 Tax=Parathielavia appendiculata TaxID=2587402 RepID=A0AAN6Z5Y8_9PEZI|nr:hypothetical protein N657DRAFT_301102 [Parathielavia appendiculata]